MKGDISVLLVAPRERTTYVDRDVTVTENRAPTDDSVKLLREMEEKTRASILEQIVVEDNIMKMKAVVYVRPDLMKHEARYSGTINGHEIGGSIIFDNRPSVTETIQEVYKKMGESIAEILLKDIVSTLPRV